MQTDIYSSSTAHTSHKPTVSIHYIHVYKWKLVNQFHGSIFEVTNSNWSIYFYQQLQDLWWPTICVSRLPQTQYKQVLLSSSPNTWNKIPYLTRHQWPTLMMCLCQESVNTAYSFSFSIHNAPPPPPTTCPHPSRSARLIKWMSFRRKRTPQKQNNQRDQFHFPWGVAMNILSIILHYLCVSMPLAWVQTSINLEELKNAPSNYLGWESNPW